MARKKTRGLGFTSAELIEYVKSLTEAQLSEIADSPDEAEETAEE
tara:strand:+ start:232 stop:366 length:135 start_codon:yes stop_codon:yes gene_type:complete